MARAADTSRPPTWYPTTTRSWGAPPLPLPPPPSLVMPGSRTRTMEGRTLLHPREAFFFLSFLIRAGRREISSTQELFLRVATTVCVRSVSLHGRGCTPSGVCNAVDAATAFHVLRRLCSNLKGGAANAGTRCVPSTGTGSDLFGFLKKEHRFPSRQAEQLLALWTVSIDAAMMLPEQRKLSLTCGHCRLAWVRAKARPRFSRSLVPCGQAASLPSGMDRGRTWCSAAESRNATGLRLPSCAVVLFPLSAVVRAASQVCVVMHHL